MRRWWAVATAGMLMCGLLTGCGTDAGTDGNLTDDWGGPPAVTSFAPQPGTCHVRSELTGYLGTYAPVDCAKVHRVETVHVGTFTGAPAGQPAPPQHGTPALRPAFADCDTRAKRFVGADWRGGRLSVRVVTPSAPAWTGGSRWYRCDLFETGGLDDAVSGYADLAQERSGTLRNALSTAGPLAHTCFHDDSSRRLRPVSCTGPHGIEYVGTWTSPDVAYARADRDRDRLYDRCHAVIARYVNIPGTADMRFRTGTTFRLPSEDGWTQGDRGIRCFLYFRDRRLTRSLKGAGPAALPVQ